jgi:uncharacterized protein YqfA (UPF0365 family)
MLAITESPILQAAVLIGIVVGVIIFGSVAKHLPLWVRARTGGAPVGMLKLIGMTLCKIDTRMVVLSRLHAKNEGIALSIDQLKSHQLAGGNARKVVDALVHARQKRVETDFDVVCVLDLLDHDPVEAVDAYDKSRQEGGTSDDGQYTFRQFAEDLIAEKDSQANGRT